MIRILCVTVLLCLLAASPFHRPGHDSLSPSKAEAGPILIPNG